VCGRQCILVVDLAIRGAFAVETGPVPRRHAFLRGDGGCLFDYSGRFRPFRPNRYGGTIR
jgi:hypothetical protein